MNGSRRCDNCGDPVELLLVEVEPGVTPDGWAWWHLIGGRVYRRCSPRDGVAVATPRA